MFQKLIDWIKGLFIKRVPQPAHEDPAAPTPIKPDPFPEPIEPPHEEGIVTGYRLTTLNRWRDCHLVKVSQHASAAQKAVKYKEQFYNPVALATGIPWYVVAAFDMREESFIHSGYLGNGDPWNKKSVHVPAGRGPFASWYEGAIDALKLEGFDKIKQWDIVSALVHCEEYNGLGYKRRGIASPYVWAGTSVQQAGKFVKDGVWSSTAWDSQESCAGLFLALKLNHGVDLREA